MPTVQPVGSVADIGDTLARWHTIGFAGRLRMGPVREEGEDALAEILVEDEDRNPGGAVHGGVAFALLDTLMGYVVNRATKGEALVGTVSQTIDYLAVPEGRLLGRARIDRIGKTQAFVSAEAHDAKGRLVARSTAVWAVRR